MKQHAIPQNVLDVEFKLFTKFTLKEFAYLAIGVGIGGLFLYLTVGKQMPAIIGIPAFLIFSAIGVFLSLVPINDQPADKFIQNYITAITNPTQRVWKSKEQEDIAQKPGVKPSKDGTLIAKHIKERPKIIGSGISESKILEETSENVKAIDKEIEEAEKATTIKQVNANNILINSENISKYQFNIKGFENIPGNINLWLSTKDYKPISNVIAQLKDSSGNLLYANKTGTNGYFLTNKRWNPDKYVVEFESEEYKFPKVEIILTGKESNLPIKISAL